MPLNQVYRKNPPFVLAITYSEFASGTGIILFNLSNSQEQTTDDYHLSENAIYSNDINTQALAASSTIIQELDLDFDVVINRPIRLKGIAKITLPLGGRTVSAAPNSWQCYAICRLKKNDVEIANAQTETISGGGGGINASESKRVTVHIDASTVVTQFAEGDILRLTVEIWGLSSGGSGANVGLGHDPKGRNDATPVNGGIIVDTMSTIAEAHIPFLIT